MHIIPKTSLYCSKVISALNKDTQHWIEESENGRNWSKINERIFWQKFYIHIFITKFYVSKFFKHQCPWSLMIVALLPFIKFIHLLTCSYLAYLAFFFFLLEKRDLANFFQILNYYKYWIDILILKFKEE